MNKKNNSSLTYQNNHIDQLAFWHDLQDTAYLSLREAIPSGSKIIYLDYPIYSNIGDILIWKGSQKWITREKHELIAQYNIDNFKFPQINNDVILVCQGGGNFGDLYKHQKHRENIVQSYPDNRIVFLPQTIHYKNIKNIDSTKKILNEHPNLSIFVRDESSFKLATTHFTGAIFKCPDMATFLYPLVKHIENKKNNNTNLKKILLIRKDVEKKEEDINYEEYIWSGDWVDILKFDWILIKLFQLYNKTSFIFNNHQHCLDNWNKFSDYLIQKSIAIFIQADEVTTSRLHGHILALLLEKKVILYDNSYGKNLAYYKEWHFNNKTIKIP